MPLTRRVSRPMLAAMFVAGGLDAVRNPEPKVPRANAVIEPVTDAVGVESDAAKLVRINGAVMIAGGVLLATGRFPRLASIALMGTLVPTTIAGHRFWEIDDPQERAQQRIHFLKNVSMFGGLMLAATDTEGAPSLTWRAKRRARRTLDALPTPG